MASKKRIINLKLGIGEGADNLMRVGNGVLSALNGAGDGAGLHPIALHPHVPSSERVKATQGK